MNLIAPTMGGHRSRGSRTGQRRHRCRRALASAAVCVALVGSLLITPSPASAQTADITTQRIPTSDVFTIAAVVAGRTCDSDTGSHSIALASGENWPDALAGAALDRPLLLTKQAFLPAATRAYLEPCASHPKAKVIILGGTAAVSENVADTLSDMGYRVDRFSGDDRYATARRVARQFAPDDISNVYLASGANFADAVAAAPSVTSDTPLILTTPKKLHDEARRFLTDTDRTVGKVIILGGNAAVSAEVEAEVEALGVETDRIAGATRYDTAAKIARRALSAPDCHPVTDVAVASGTVPYGGLVAGAMRDPCQPLLLAPDPGSDVPEALTEFGRDWNLAIGTSTKSHGHRHRLVVGHRVGSDCGGRHRQSPPVQAPPERSARVARLEPGSRGCGAGRMPHHRGPYPAVRLGLRRGQRPPDRHQLSRDRALARRACLRAHLGVARRHVH